MMSRSQFENSLINILRFARPTEIFQCNFGILHTLDRIIISLIDCRNSASRHSNPKTIVTLGSKLHRIKICKNCTGKYPGILFHSPMIIICNGSPTLISLPVKIINSTRRQRIRIDIDIIFVESLRHQQSIESP